MENKIKVFESKEVRTVWNAEEEEYYFSVVDVVAVLTDSQDPKQYIKKMRSRDTELASKWGTICTPVEMVGLDGRRRKIQAANTKNILRIIQSIPSPKAEPFKVWLAQVGSERLDEIADPEKAILRGAEYYRRKGYPEGWINQRLQTIEMRKELTDEWKARGIEQERELCHFDKRNDQSVERTYRTGVQASQGTEKRKSARQHDQYRTGPEYVGGSFNYRDFQSKKTGNLL